MKSMYSVNVTIFFNDLFIFVSASRAATILRLLFISNGRKLWCEWRDSAKGQVYPIERCGSAVKITTNQ